MTEACVLIANKGAGSFSGQVLERVQNQLRAGGVVAELWLAGDFNEISGLAARASRLSGGPLVVAAGGDGTINAVLNGLAGSGATCALMPLGTANVLARELGIDSPEEAVRRIVAGTSRPFSAGLIRGNGRETRFFLMAGIGLDGYVVRGVTLPQKRRFGKGAYLLAAVRHAFAWDRGRMQVTTATERFSCHTLVVCNTARYGGSFLLAPQASIFSPNLELVAVRATSRGAYLRLAAALLRGRSPAAGDDLLTLQADRVCVEGMKPIQVDGDDWGDTPVEISVEKEYGRIIV